MAVTLHSRISDFGRKLDVLLSRYENLEREKNALAERVSELQDENGRLRAELEARARDVHFLTMSHRLASNPDTIVETRREIESLIRDIDKCISQLKE